MAEPISVDEQSFEEAVIKSQLPVLVDFWASWCGPCTAVAPIVKELAGDYEGRVSFAKVNVDENPRIAANYGIQAIPTLLIFNEGKPVRQAVGLQPKKELQKLLDDVLG